MKYSIARNMTCLDPRYMAKHRACSKLKLKKMLEVLVTQKRVHEDDVDVLNRMYSEFLKDVVGGDNMAKFRDFDVVEGRVYEAMGTDKRFGKLWKVVRKLLLLSHGQASVERGFSVNRQVEKENMSEGMHVALRCICDYLSYAGGILEVTMTKELSSASGARQSYNRYLEEQRQKKAQDVVMQKRKYAMEDIDVLRKKSKTIDMDITALGKSAVGFADEAEKARGATSHAFIVKSNAMR